MDPAGEDHEIELPGLEREEHETTDEVKLGNGVQLHITSKTSLLSTFFSSWNSNSFGGQLFLVGQDLPTTNAAE